MIRAFFLRVKLYASHAKKACCGDNSTVGVYRGYSYSKLRLGKLI